MKITIVGNYECDNDQFRYQTYHLIQLTFYLTLSLSYSPYPTTHINNLLLLTTPSTIKNDCLLSPRHHHQILPNKSNEYFLPQPIHNIDYSRNNNNDNNNDITNSKEP